jgi:hypothetical protein
MKLRLFVLCMLISIIAFSQKQVKKIEIKHLTKNVYVCISYGYPPGGHEPFPANSLFAVTPKGIVLVNTPWGDEQTQQLVDSVKQRFNKKIIFCVATHFHDDCVGGLDVLKKQGAKTYTSKQTYILAKKEKNELPQYTFAGDTTFTIGGVTLQTYYPGEGHTKDNIVVWVPQDKVLFGGCLVKSLEADTQRGLPVMPTLNNGLLSIKNVQGLRYKDAQLRYSRPSRMAGRLRTVKPYVAGPQRNNLLYLAPRSLARSFIMTLYGFGYKPSLFITQFGYFTVAVSNSYSILPCELSLALKPRPVLVKLQVAPVI